MIEPVTMSGIARKPLDHADIAQVYTSLNIINTGKQTIGA